LLRQLDSHPSVECSLQIYLHEYLEDRIDIYDTRWHNVQNLIYKI